jgi:hypothetical protein
MFCAAVRGETVRIMRRTAVYRGGRLYGGYGRVVTAGGRRSWRTAAGRWSWLEPGLSCNMAQRPYAAKSVGIDNINVEDRFWIILDRWC